MNFSVNIQKLIFFFFYRMEQENKKQKVEKIILKIEQLKNIILLLNEDWENDQQYQKLREVRKRYENMVMEMKQNHSLLL